MTLLQGKARRDLLAKWEPIFDRAIENCIGQEGHDYLVGQKEKGLVIVEDKGVQYAVAFGWRFDRTKKEIWLVTEDGGHMPAPYSKYRYTYLTRGVNGIYWPPGVFAGKTSMMGYISHRIMRSGSMVGR